MAKSYGGTNKEHLMSYYHAIKKESDDAMKNIRAAQDVALRQYMCAITASDKKKDWQSKAYIPIAKSTVKKAVRLVKKALLDSETFFDFHVTSSDEQTKKFADLMRRTLLMHLTQDKFLETFSECLESGFVLGQMIMKVWVENVSGHFKVDIANDQYVKTSLPRLRFKAINPYDFHFTPDKRIMIEDEFVKVHDLISAAEKGDTGLDKKIVKELVTGDYSGGSASDERSARLRKLGILEHNNQFRHDVLISHVWGPVLNAKGKITMENAHWLVANDKYVISQPTPNPFIHGSAPYVLGSPIPVIFRYLGKGIIEDVAPLEEAIINFVNLQIDNMKWIMLGINEVDEMALSDNAKDEMRDLYPGKLVRKRTGYEKPAFNHTEIGTDPSKAMGLLNELKQFYDMDTSITEYVQSVAGSRQDTLGEYEGKRGSAMQDFASIAGDIEKGFMVDCIDMARDLVVQYMYRFERYPEIKILFDKAGLDVSALTGAQKKALIVNDLDIVGRGISIFFDRMDKLNKLGTYVKMLNALPDDAQFYPKWSEVLKRINDAFAFDQRDELVRTDEEAEKAKAQMQQAQEKEVMRQIQMQQAEWQKEIKIEQMKIQASLRELTEKLASDAEEREKDMTIAVLRASTDLKKAAITKKNSKNDSTKK